MTQPTIGDVRDLLFAQMKALSKPDATSETLDKSRAMAELAQTIINSGKLELDYMKHTGQTGTGFIQRIDDGEEPAKSKTPTGVKTSKTPTGVKTIVTQQNGLRQTTHKLAG